MQMIARRWALLGALVLLGGVSACKNSDVFNQVTLGMTPTVGTTLPAATVGTPWSQTFTIVQGTNFPPYTLQTSQTPPGIGAIQNGPTTFTASGTPTLAGTYKLSLVIGDARQGANPFIASWTLVVN